MRKATRAQWVKFGIVTLLYHKILFYVIIKARLGAFGKRFILPFLY